MKRTILFALIFTSLLLAPAVLAGVNPGIQAILLDDYETAFEYGYHTGVYSVENNLPRDPLYVVAQLRKSWKNEFRSAENQLPQERKLHSLIRRNVKKSLTYSNVIIFLDLNSGEFNRGFKQGVRDAASGAVQEEPSYETENLTENRNSLRDLEHERGYSEGYNDAILGNTKNPFKEGDPRRYTGKYALRQLELQTQLSTLSAGYIKGYREGYDQGLADRGSSSRPNIRLSETANVLDARQDGYDKGYADGFAGKPQQPYKTGDKRTYSRQLHPRPDFQYAYGQAGDFVSGYRDGYTQGRLDRYFQ